MSIQFAEAATQKRRFELNDSKQNRIDRNRIVGSVLSLAVVRGADYLIPIITLPYLVKTIGVDGYGTINYAISICLYFGAVMQYGFSITTTREVARNQTNNQAVSRIYSETLCAISLLAAACAIVFVPAVLMLHHEREQRLLHTLTFVFIAAQALLPIWLYQGMERLKDIALVTTACRAGSLAGILLLVNNREDYYIVPAIHATSAIVALAMSAVIIRFRYGIIFKIPHYKMIFGLYKKGGDVFVYQLAPNLYNNSASFLLGAYSGASTLGIFSAASKVIDIFNSAGTILSNAVFPFLARNQFNADKIHKRLIITGVFLSIICFCAAGPISALLFPTAADNVATHIRLLSPGVLAFFAVMVFQNNGLLIHGKDASARRSSLWVSTVSFLFGVAVIPLVGSLGAVIMIVGARAALAISGYIIYKRH